MSRRFMALNVLLVAASVLLAAYIVRELTAPIAVPVGGRRGAGPSPAAGAAGETPRAPAAAYSVVAARNLFSPTRTEAPTGTGLASAPPLVKPNLYGVVLRDGAPIAYLEDPTTKRVTGYHVGDKIVGGTVLTIKADSVVIARPDGDVDVRLRDPGKPRATQPAAAVAAPPAATALPGVIPPAPPAPQAQGQPQPGQPLQPGPPVAGVPPQGVTPQPPQSPTAIPPPVVPGRRPLPPNLLRRLPPGMGDATQQ